MNDATNLIANEAKSIVQAHLDRLGEPKDIHLSDEVKQEKFAQILAELKNATLSLSLTIIAIPKFRSWLNCLVAVFQIHWKWHVFGRDHPASTLVVAGVKFMGETSKNSFS